MSIARAGRVAAAAIGALFAAVAIRDASFAATITDGSGYVSEAVRWMHADLFTPQPFALWPAWPAASAVPLGHRLGPIAGTDVFIYPPGLPLMMAAAMNWGGELAAYVVPPLFGALLIWATGELAARLAGERARLGAALLMATSAVTFVGAVQPMSDVPAAAWWTLALVFATRAHVSAAVAAGLAVSMAVLTRPNLAPLALLPTILVLGAAQARRWPRAVAFGMTALAGPLLLLWLQAVLYGSPWASGHPDIGQLFARSNVVPNAWTYLAWYAEAHTWLVVVAVLAPLLFWPARAAAAGDCSPRLLTGVLVAMVVGVYAAYLPYAQWEDWYFVRFMLPALGPLYALTAAVLAHGSGRLPRTMGTPVFVVVLLVATAGQARETYARRLVIARTDNQRIAIAGRYLASALPANAVVLTAFHSGSVRHYTGRPVLRADLVPPEALDAMLQRLEQSGYHPYLLIDDWLERGGYLARFTSSRFGALNWSPRAIIGSQGHIVLYDPRDREARANGATWSIDVVR